MPEGLTGRTRDQQEPLTAPRRGHFIRDGGFTKKKKKEKKKEERKNKKEKTKRKKRRKKKKKKKRGRNLCAPRGSAAEPGKRNRPMRSARGAFAERT